VKDVNGKPIRWRACKLCRDPQREQAERDLLRGTTVAEVSRRYGLTDRLVARHLDKHMAHARKEMEREARRKGLRAGDALVSLVRRLERLTDRTEAALGDPHPLDVVALRGVLADGDVEQALRLLESWSPLDAALVQAARGLIGETRACVTDLARISGEMPTVGGALRGLLERFGVANEDEACRLVGAGRQLESVARDPHEIAVECRKYLAWYDGPFGPGEGSASGLRVEAY